jgi:bifunctional non-homologous end joining protein LigD
MPGFIKPQLATLRSKAPSGANWLHEIKFDGYRIQLHIDGDTRKAFTRNGLHWIKRFSNIAGAFSAPGKRSSMGKWSLFTKVALTFPNYRPTLPGVIRIACCITPSISYGSTAKTFAKRHRSSERRY